MTYKCKNCKFIGDVLSIKPIKDKCPICGDDVNELRNEETKKVELVKEDAGLFDLNKDGKIDKDDLKLAGSALKKLGSKLKRGKK